MSEPRSAAIYFHPEAYSIDGPKLMGRNAAGAAFMRAYWQHVQTPVHWIQAETMAHAQVFAQWMQGSGQKGEIKSAFRDNLAALREPGAVYYPGPGIGTHAWYRAAHGHGAWSLCGVTHTTSSAAAMDDLTQLVTAPVQAWDALICTSHAVRANVEKVLQAQFAHLQERLGAQRLTLPQLPVIPLGVHCQDFDFTPAQRSRAREALGADAHTHVVLFMGRLSFHAKAHPLAMYQALEVAAQQLPAGERVLLVECGWHANDPIAHAFAQAAQAACPSVQVRTLDGRLAEERETAWAGADVFCSLSDNIQETFGITPVEAMAAGLPVVVSDWDGYRDTVRHGVDGFCLPTTMPAAGMGADLAYRHALGLDTYDMYCGLTSTLVAVDVPAASRALSALLQSPSLRQKMGAAGRERARSVYDWQHIMQRYQALWGELHDLRLSQGSAVAHTPSAWPARLDPFSGFAGYATHTLQAHTVLALVDADVEVARARVQRARALAMVNFARAVLPSEAETDAVLARLHTQAQPVAALLQDVTEARKKWVGRGLAWLLKLGVVRRQD